MPPKTPQMHQYFLFSSKTLLILSQFASYSVSSSIHLFGDEHCVESQNNITGPNGYPDGSCTKFGQWAPGKYSSFQVFDLDPGCSVNVYGSDTNRYICSSNVVETTETNTCYNASWVYYSIDGCISPDETPSAVPTSSDSPSTGAIVGGVVGGVVALAVLIGALLYARRTRALHMEQQAYNAQLRQDLYELASRRQLVELVDRRSPVEMEAGTLVDPFAAVKGKSPVLPGGAGDEQMGNIQDGKSHVLPSEDEDGAADQGEAQKRRE